MNSDKQKSSPTLSHPAQFLKWFAFVNSYIQPTRRSRFGCMSDRFAVQSYEELFQSKSTETSGLKFCMGLHYWFIFCIKDIYLS